MSVNLHNLALFIWGVIRYAIPPYRWPAAWRHVAEGHRAEVHKMVWELKCQGKIYEDTDHRLWPK